MGVVYAQKKISDIEQLLTKQGNGAGLFPSCSQVFWQHMAPTGDSLLMRRKV